MRPVGSAEVLESRRRRAVDFVRKGFSLNAVARKLGCFASSVLRWWRKYRRQGDAGLKVKPTPGRPPRLTRSQRRRLLKLLLQGAMKHGYRTDLWTTQRIADVIRKHFGVKYHRDHIGRLMAKCGWSCQKPERRATQRDEVKIEQWRKEKWPRIKKKPVGWGPTSFS